MNKIIVIAFLSVFSVSLYSQSIDFANERLKYNAKYGFIKGGEVRIDTKRVIRDSNDCYNVKIDMYAIGVVNDIFHFHDVFESTFLVSTFKPLVFIRDAQEGSYKQYEEVYYFDDHVFSSIKGRFDTKERYFDIVSTIFALRNRDWSRLKNGDILSFPVYFDENVFNIKVVYKGKERVKIGKRTYFCNKFSPVFSGSKTFQKNGVNVYFSDDSRKKPILIQVNFRVGSFRVEIDE